MQQTTLENPMRRIRIAKVTLNIGAGESGEKLEKGKMILEKIVGKKPVTTVTPKRNTFGMAKNRPIGAMITLRGTQAIQILKNLLQAVDFKLKPEQFDDTGNFAFGIKEYINVPGLKYIPEIGIIGFAVAVTLERPGYRVKRRAIRPAPVGKRHQIARDEAMAFARQELAVKIVEEEA